MSTWIIFQAHRPESGRKVIYVTREGEEGYAYYDALKDVWRNTITGSEIQINVMLWKYIDSRSDLIKEKYNVR